MTKEKIEHKKYEPNLSLGRPINGCDTSLISLFPAKVDYSVELTLTPSSAGCCPTPSLSYGLSAAGKKRGKRCENHKSGSIFF